MSGAVLTYREILQWHGPDSGMAPWMWGWGYHIGLFSIVIMGLFWVALIVAIIFLIRWIVLSAGRKNRAARAEDPALEILRLRYARGEINKEEFDQKKRDLGYP